MMKLLSSSWETKYSDCITRTPRKTWTQKITSWNNFPTKDDPEAKYKYLSFEINLNLDLRQIDR